MKHLEFSVEKMRQEMERIGYPQSSIYKSVERWRIYDGLEVEFDGLKGEYKIKGMKLVVPLRWCEHGY